MEELPTEILERVIYYLDPQDLLNISIVNKKIKYNLKGCSLRRITIDTTKIYKLLEYRYAYIFSYCIKDFNYTTPNFDDSDSDIDSDSDSETCCIC